MSNDLRTILDRVASGEISPEEGQRLLAGSDAAPIVPTPQTPVQRVAVRATGVRLSVLADPGVATAVAEGPHRVQHEGDRLVISSDLSTGDYTAETPWSTFRNWLDSGFRAAPRIDVRVNPELPLDLVITAGTLNLSGMQSPVSASVEAASAKLENGRGPLTLNATTGSADVSWQFTGSSTVVAELGAAKLRVLPGSDAVITAEGLSGSVKMHGPGATASAEGSDRFVPPVTVGDGNGSLAINARLGSVDVTVP